ncbi:MAG: hypothetical protein ACRD8W_24510 [Nitrososphaeraceae archaeon]
MTDTIFNLQVKLVADDDRAREQDRILIEHLIRKALIQVLPEARILEVNFTKKD